MPRFHLPWGTGTGVSGPFAATARAAAEAGLLGFRFRHRVDGLVIDQGAVTGVRGTVLAPDDAARGIATTRREVREFVLTAQAVVLATGGIGANHDLVRELWPARLGTPPATMLTGVPAHVDGRMLGIAEASGARVVNKDRMWHYTEGVANWDPIWAGHGIRILPGPSAMWFDAFGRRLPAPGIPGHDTLGTLRLLRADPALAGFDHSWFVASQRIVEKEFALSGSEQNPDLTDHDWPLLLRTRLGRGPTPPVAAFERHGTDFVVADDLPALVRGHEPARLRRRRSSPRRSSGRSGSGMRSSRTPSRRTRRCRASTTAAVPAATASRGWRRRIGSWTPRRGRSSPCGCTC